MIWFAIRVSAGREFNCEQVLRDAGIATFVPIVHFLARQSRHMKAKALYARPLLYGYIFVGFNWYPGALEWCDLFRFRLVHSVVGFGDTPMSISEAEMFHVLKLTQRPIPFLRKRKSRKAFRGEKAEIRSGPYQGRTVRISGIEGKRAIELFELFQQPLALRDVAC